jgi:hypothetical protein
MDRDGEAEERKEDVAAPKDGERFLEKDGEEEEHDHKDPSSSSSLLSPLPSSFSCPSRRVGLAKERTLECSSGWTTTAAVDIFC